MIVITFGLLGKLQDCRVIDQLSRWVRRVLTNKAAMEEIDGRGETPIIVRQVKYLNNIVEQDHRAIKRVTRPMLNFKSFRLVKSEWNLV